MKIKPLTFFLIPASTLLVLALLITFERLHTYNEPMERDLTTYALMGQGLLEGRELYTDLWDCKPPGLYLIFAAAQWASGSHGPLSVFVINLFFSISTLAALYLAAGRGGDRAQAIWAALFWAILSGDLTLEANQPNTEVILNAFLTLAFYFWLQAQNRSWDWKPVAWAGFFSLMASFCKQTAAINAIVMGFTFLLLATGPKDRIDRLKKTLLFLGILFLGWLCVAGYFYSRHRFDDFYYAVFSYNFLSNNDYLGSGKNLWERMSGFRFGSHAIEFLIPLALLGIWGAVRRTKKWEPYWVFWLAFLIAAILQIFAPGQFHPHYYQVLLPPLLIGGVWGCFQLGIDLRKNYHWPVFLPQLAILLILLIHETPFYFLPEKVWSEKKYGILFNQSMVLGEELGQILRPEETFFEWGNETGLYFYSKRYPPSGIFHTYPLERGFRSTAMSEKLIQDLENNKPEMFVIPYPDLTDPKNGQVVEWFRQRYRHLPGGSRGPFFLFMRKGGELEKRVKTGGF